MMLVSKITHYAWKRETSGNETGNEIVSTASDLVFNEKNEDSRKPRKSSDRKRETV